MGKVSRDTNIEFVQKVICSYNFMYILYIFIF